MSSCELSGFGLRVDVVEAKRAFKLTVKARRTKFVKATFLDLRLGSKSDLRGTEVTLPPQAEVVAKWRARNHAKR